MSTRKVARDADPVVVTVKARSLAAASKLIADATKKDLKRLRKRNKTVARPAIEMKCLKPVAHATFQLGATDSSFCTDTDQHVFLREMRFFIMKGNWHAVAECARVILRAGNRNLVQFFWKSFFVLVRNHPGCRPEFLKEFLFMALPAEDESRLDEFIQRLTGLPEAEQAKPPAAGEGLDSSVYDTDNHGDTSDDES